MTTRDDRLNRGIHGLRGVAALMVLLAHILGGTAEHVYAADAAYAAAVAPFWNFGVFFVYVFFAISGYVIVPSIVRHTPREFAVRRLVRIYPLFLAATALFVAGNAVLELQPKLNDPGTILAALTFLNLLAGTEQLTPNAWSLSYEAMFYVGIGLAALAVRRRSVLVGAATAILAAAFVVRFPGALYFLVGAAAYVVDRRGILDALGTPLCRAVELGAAVAVAVAASRHFYAYAPADVLRPGAQAAILSTALYFPFAVRRDSLTALLLSGRAPQFLGTISYSLYLVHPYVYMPLRVLFAKAGWFGADPRLSVALFAAVVVPLALAASTLSWRLFEVWPQRLLRRRDAAVTAPPQEAAAPEGAAPPGAAAPEWLVPAARG